MANLMSLFLALPSIHTYIQKLALTRGHIQTWSHTHTHTHTPAVPPAAALAHAALPVAATAAVAVAPASTCVVGVFACTCV